MLHTRSALRQCDTPTISLEQTQPISEKPSNEHQNTTKDASFRSSVLTSTIPASVTGTIPLQTTPTPLKPTTDHTPCPGTTLDPFVHQEVDRDALDIVPLLRENTMEVRAGRMVMKVGPRPPWDVTPCV
ncbi:hypothetical protein J8273_3431 [Carpediemonas membranifera]|uniref:Uncharacterized protein n=1 Tax=Carpediemonas membranifera TaxID=201153 RepID=A0A8J6ASY6_9EUKA|nr:hypothetical protein J8273_3431 [Carpediemonas membranifera]|eukprot:KAG9393298.1 hypothetical protein J8273_3431 [Carpediemonas membranifera]